MAKLRIKRGEEFKVQPPPKKKFQDPGDKPYKEMLFREELRTHRNVMTPEESAVFHEALRNATVTITEDGPASNPVISLSAAPDGSVAFSDEERMMEWAVDRGARLADFTPPPLCYTDESGESYRIYPEMLKMPYTSSAMSLNTEANRLLSEAEPAYDDTQHPPPSFLLEHDHLLSLAHQAEVAKVEAQAWIGRFCLMSGVAFVAVFSFIVQFWGN